MYSQRRAICATATKCKRWLRALHDHFGAIDILINNAGVIIVGPLEEMTIEDFENAMDSNFWSGVYTIAGSVARYANRRRSGRIVNITSIGGKIAVPHLLPYSASKFAFAGFSRGLRSEVMKDGIVVTTVVPGLMRTGSPRNADFKGKNQLEYAWFSISDSLPDRFHGCRSGRQADYRRHEARRSRDHANSPGTNRGGCGCVSFRSSPAACSLQQIECFPARVESASESRKEKTARLPLLQAC